MYVRRQLALLKGTCGLKRRIPIALEGGHVPRRQSRDKIHGGVLVHSFQCDCHTVAASRRCNTQAQRPLLVASTGTGI